MNLGILLIINTSLFISVFWLIVYCKKDTPIKQNNKFPPLSILIPAFNEYKNILCCIDSLLKQNYPNLKILVIDDGSTDNTGVLVKSVHCIRYLRKRNGGKASALNLGLKYVDTELFGVIDADSCISKNTLRNSVNYFHDNVASVTVAIKPHNPNGRLESLQKVEYMLSSFTKHLMCHINSLFWTPCFSLYKTDVVKKLGGFDENNITEDLEIGLKLKANSFMIENNINDYAYTVLPKGIKALFRQRIRWARGFFYNTRKYSHMFFKSGFLGSFILPLSYVLVFEYFLLVLLIFNSLFIPSFGPYVLYCSIITLLAFLIILRLSRIKTNEKVSIVEYIIYIVIYPFLNMFFWIIATIQEIVGIKRKW